MCEPVVSVGQKVLLGEKIGDSDAFISAPVHSSVSGVIKDIRPHLTVSGTIVKSVIIENDGAFTEHDSIKPRDGFEALSREEIISVAVIDRKKCTSCGKCVAVCPKKLIEIVPDKSKVRVACNSADKGKLMRENCRAGCIGCNICQKTCKVGAITLQNNLAHVDYDKCTLCMDCVNKCPSKAIMVMQ